MSSSFTLMEIPLTMACWTLALDLPVVLSASRTRGLSAMVALASSKCSEVHIKEVSSEVVILTGNH